MFFVQCSCGAKSEIKLSDILSGVGNSKEIVVEGKVDIVIGDYELINVYCSECEMDLINKEKNI
ncbi:hypothetical protein [Bacillus toyonensis]|uniref:hypothetical protein n=1 Tax=Bacillus toyonensis TaxID=155322 RepID=UPI002E223443|nr:hypothetical protein [Bacillus toyonensis]